MEEAARDSDIEIGSLGFSEMMDLVTGRLREEIPLPSYEEFAAEYREHPERFDAMLLEPTADVSGSPEDRDRSDVPDHPDESDDPDDQGATSE